MSTLLETLEWMARYGFIDILFGIGVITLIGNLIAKLLPSNYKHLHVNVSPGGPVNIPRVGQVPQSIEFHFRNSGQANFYIARAYFRPKQRRWFLIWAKEINTKLRVHPQSDRITDRDAFELKFPGQRPLYFTEYEALVRPGHQNVKTTWLALESPLSQDLINKRRCGVLFLEYATSGKQGKHRVRV